MPTHVISDSASIDVTIVPPVFFDMSPKIDRSTTTPRVRCLSPHGQMHTVKIGFKFKPRGITSTMMIGIRQVISPDWHIVRHKGNKPTDGLVLQTFRPQHRHVLDVATTQLEVLWEPGTNYSTGAVATAPHAPFFSSFAFGFKDGVEVEQFILDAPGGAYDLEIRNAATDRMNFLDSVDVKQTFLTYLTVVKEDGSHVPLEGVYWQVAVRGTVLWNSKGEPEISQLAHKPRLLGFFKKFDPGFLVVDFGFLSNASLRASDCINQKFNDAMFAVRGMYKRQNFSKPSRSEIRLSAKGYELIQYPFAQ